MDSLMISPEMAEEKLPGCKVGDKKWLMVEVEVTDNSEEGLSADVLDVKYAPGHKKGTEEGEKSAAKPRAAVLAVLKGSDEDESDGY